MSIKNRGLGRGLDALLPKTDRGIQQIAVKHITVSPLQPRRVFAEDALAELAGSIREKGILQPLLVRGTPGNYELVAGERRFRAAQLAGLTSVPALVRELTDQETLEIAIIENLQRENLNPVEEAHAFQKLSEFGLTQERIAQAVSRSRSAIANSLRLLQLPEEALEALENGAITAGHARAILAREPEERLWLLEQIIALNLTVREAETFKQPRAARRNPIPNFYRQLADDLGRHAGTKVRIAGKGKGRIELYFHNEDELQRLIELLGYQP